MKRTELIIFVKGENSRSHARAKTLLLSQKKENDFLSFNIHLLHTCQGVFRGGKLLTKLVHVVWMHLVIECAAEPVGLWLVQNRGH